MTDREVPPATQAPPAPATQTHGWASRLATLVAGRHWSGWLTGGVLLAMLGLAVGELSGWALLAGPLDRLASQALGRQVTTRAPLAPPEAARTPWQLRLLGGISLTAPRLTIAAPEWSQAPHMVFAQDVQLKLRYSDLWHAWQGGALHIERLQASTLNAWLERRADGRASWQFGSAPSDNSSTSGPMPVLEVMQVATGHVRLADAPAQIELDIELSLTADKSSLLPARPNAAGSETSQSAEHLRLRAAGSFMRLPLQLSLSADGRLPWLAQTRQAPSMPLALTLGLGQAQLEFQGSAQGIWDLQALSGQFKLRGVSLAAVGSIVGVTLPTTGAFHIDGRLAKQGLTWNVLVDDATVGSSRLHGAFSYEAGRAVPLLAGRLGGSLLMLNDLAPAIGGDVAAKPAEGEAKAAHASRVLPDRRFDLASLKLMDANLLINIDRLDLNHPSLRPMRPLKAHLQLNGGQLRLSELDAHTGQGRLRGEVQLDGHGEDALVQAKLAWNAVQLEQWIEQPRASGKPPYIAGKLYGRADVRGKGRSTAEILGSLSGQFQSELHNGAVSHLLIEAAGIDIAQGLGTLIMGDKALPVQCAVTSIDIESGVLRPTVMVMDTPKSTIWVDGHASLADETLNLRMVVSPTDFSPLALRTPWQVRGTFSEPSVSLNRKVIGTRLVAAAALAFVSPWAALIPLIDPGNSSRAHLISSGCDSLMKRAKAAPPMSIYPVSAPRPLSKH